MSPFLVGKLVQSLDLLPLQAPDQHRERGSAATVAIELRLVLERSPPAPELVEELHPPELVQRVGVECHAATVAAGAPRRIGAVTDRATGKPRCRAPSPTPLSLLVADIVALWAVSTVRHTRHVPRTPVASH
jgi:hypothetical protein